MRRFARPKLIAAVAAIAVAATVAVVVLAQTGGFDVTWQSTSTGGATATSSGGGFELQGVIGQPGAGTSSGGGFELSGGFLSAAAVTTLTLTDVEPESLVAGAVGDVDVTFTLASPLPADGKVVITFPEGFALSSGATTSIGADGTSFDGSVSLELTNVKNPINSGSTGTYAIQTADSSGAAIDRDTSVSADTIIGALTSTDVEPESLVAGALGDVDVSFTLDNALPVDGKVVVTFPEGYALSSGATTSIGDGGTSFDGTESASISGQTVTITRSGDGTEVAAGTAITIELTSVKNPTIPASTGTYAIVTKSSADATIDQDTTVATDTLTPGTLTDTDVEPESLLASDVGDGDVSFTLANPLPADGKIVLTFPDGFALSSDATTSIGDDGTSFDGSASIAVSGQTVTIIRSGGTEVAADATVTIELTSIKNPPVSGTTGNYAISTTDASDALINQDGATGPDTITPADLTATDVEPELLTAGVVGDVDVAFTLANPLPADGTIVVTFPAGFTLSSGATTGIGDDDTSFDGFVTVTVSGQSVTITRGGGTDVDAGAAVTLELTNVKNPTESGSTGTYTVTTSDGAGAAIDPGHRSQRRHHLRRTHLDRRRARVPGRRRRRRRRRIIHFGQYASRRWQGRRHLPRGLRPQQRRNHVNWRRRHLVRRLSLGFHLGTDRNHHPIRRRHRGRRRYDRHHRAHQRKEPHHPSLHRHLCHRH